jgi:ABC-type sugar transport system permease subunit
VLGLMFVVPALILLVRSFVEPTVWTIRSSFQRWNGFSAPREVGTENYEQVINVEFWTRRRRAAVSVPLVVRPHAAAAHRTMAAWSATMPPTRCPRVSGAST